MEFLIILAILCVIVLVVSAPLREAAAARSAGQRPAGTADESAVNELEAAREAKYREIRDAELDFRTGKLSEEDYRQLDATLRADAVEILAMLDRASARQRQPA